MLLISKRYCRFWLEKNDIMVSTHYYHYKYIEYVNNLELITFSSANIVSALKVSELFIWTLLTILQVRAVWSMVKTSLCMPR